MMRLGIQIGKTASWEVNSAIAYYLKPEGSLGDQQWL